MENKELINRIEKALLEARRERLEILSRTHKIEIETVKNTSSLEEHMRRTAANETRIQKMEDFKWYFAGISAVLLTIAQVVGKYL